MNYEASIDYLFSQLPMYQQVGPKAIKKGLTNITALCEKIGNPQNSFSSVHVAGTNGKGSTCSGIASILQEAGYKTGLYTSPHYKDFRERIKLNGQFIPKDAVASFITKYKSHFDKIKPSYFEITVAMAFWYFAEQKVDIAVIETGLGGRLDSTNILDPQLSIITNIGKDHTNVLGNKISAIATEKAGIIKEITPVIIGEYNSDTAAIFLKIANEKNAELSFANQTEACPYESDLTGPFQEQNIQTIYASIKKMIEMGCVVSEDNIKTGLKSVVENTQMMGRWQTIDTDPLTIVDSAHNVDSMKIIVKRLKELDKKIHFVLGMVKDKDIDGVLKLLPKNAAYYFCKADIPRGLDANKLYEKARQFGLKGDVYPTVDFAFEAAQDEAEEDDLVFVSGSIFVVAEVL